MLLFEKILILVIIVIIINVPFGSYRILTRKFSLAWWLSIHIPIPFIIILRSSAFHLPAWVIPISLAAAIVGHIIGSRTPKCGQGSRRLFKQIGLV